MAKRRYFALGMALGMALTAGAQVYAADTVNTVTTYLKNNFSITYGGKVQDKKGYDLLVYKDRSYMPVRYLSEMLGCNVKWDEANKSITIENPKENAAKNTESNNQPNQPDKKSQIIDNTGYGKLPQTVETANYRVSATVLSDNDDEGKRYGRRLYIILTNKTSNDVLRLYQDDIQFDINGKKSKYTDIDSELIDNRWYSNVAYEKDNKNGSTIEGFIRLPDDVKADDLVKITVKIGFDGKAKIPVELKLDMSKIK